MFVDATVFLSYLSRLRGPFIAEMELMKRAIGWFGCDATVPLEYVALTAPTAAPEAAAAAVAAADDEQARD